MGLLHLPQDVSLSPARRGRRAKRQAGQPAQGLSRMWVCDVQHRKFLCSSGKERTASVGSGALRCRGGLSLPQLGSEPRFLGNGWLTSSKFRASAKSCGASSHGAEQRQPFAFESRAEAEGLGNRKPPPNKSLEGTANSAALIARLAWFRGCVRRPSAPAFGAYELWSIISFAMGTNLIQSDPSVMMGKPVVAGTRITVELILEKLAAGETVEQMLEAHPRLTREAISAALLFAAQSLPKPFPEKAA